MKMYFENVNVIKLMNEFTLENINVIQASSEEDSVDAIFEFEDNSDTNKINSVYEKHIPIPTTTPPTEIEKLRADVDYLAIVTGVDL